MTATLPLPQIIKNLSSQLSSSYGKGFGRSSLFNMSRFASVYPDIQTIQTLSGQLSWSHLIEILSFNDFATMLQIHMLHCPKYN